MVGRVLLIIAAFVVAALGVLLVFLYAQGADDRALQGLEPTPVLVLTKPVPAGTSVTAAVEAGAFELVDRPVDAVPSGALSDTAEVLDSVTLLDLYPGEILLSQKLGDPTERDLITIPDGLIATSYVLDAPNRVADFIAPGSEIAVFVTVEEAREEQTDEAAGEVIADDTTQSTRLLLPEVKVLAVGTAATVTQTRTNPDGAEETIEVDRALITLGVSQQQAEQLILGQTLGSLYLGLLSDTSQIQPGQGVTVDNLFEVAAP